MATRNQENPVTEVPVTETKSPEISAEVTALIVELQIALRGMNPKKATPRQVRRGLATIKAVIADIDEEISK